MRIGVDTGGTYTDLVAQPDTGSLYVHKVRSTPSDPSEAILRALREALDLAGHAGALPRLSRKSRQLEIIHGTTVATNTLLTRSGSRVALLTTAGFEDVLELGRQERTELYSLAPTAPPPLVARNLRFGVQERVGLGPGNPLRPVVLRELTGAAIEQAMAFCRAGKAQAVALCLLHSYSFPQHEQRLAAALRAELQIPVFVSSELDPQSREYERTSTTVMHAYLSGCVSSYLSALEQRLAELQAVGWEPRLRILSSSGGSLTAQQAIERPAELVLSGPAGGALAAQRIAAQAGEPSFIGLDMGGTSTDVCLGWHGSVQRDQQSTLDGLPLRTNRLAIHTVGAGGGSIAHAGPGGALLVGPQSAGSDPGPACYGRGTDLTVTDAALLEGLIPRNSLLADDQRLDARRSEAAAARLGGALGLDAGQLSSGTLRIAVQRMADAARAVSQARGYDPRGCTLVAFGGAGPLFGCQVAAELGLRTVLISPFSGCLSALGCLLSAPALSARRSVMARLDELERTSLLAAVRELGGGLRSRIGGNARLRGTYLLRYAGQSHELAVETETGRLPAASTLRRLFEEQHLLRYGYAQANAQIELTFVELTAQGSESAVPVLPPSPGWSGGHAPGPARRARTIMAQTFSAHIPAGWTAAEDRAGNLRLTRRA